MFICEEICYLQYQGHGNNRNVCEQINRYRKCGIYIQWNISVFFFFNFSVLKERDATVCNNMDKAGKHYAKLISQALKYKYCMIPLHEESKIVKLLEVETEWQLHTPHVEGKQAGIKFWLHKTN